MKKRIFAGILITCMLLSTVACTKKDSQTSGEKPTEVEIFLPAGGKIFLEDDPIIAEIEKKTNTDITLNLANSSNVLSDYSILVASGSVPDVTVLSAFQYYQFVDQGIYLEVDDLVEKYGQNIKKAVGDVWDSSWKTLDIDGKHYAIPKVTSPGKYLTVARKDWMENLGIETPETLDQYIDMVKRFTTEDPDKNGQNDTYGLSYVGAGSNSAYVTGFAHIFGAYGIQPNIHMIKDNKLHASSVSPEYKEAVKTIAQLYQEGVIDPEFFIQKADQAKQKAATGKIGSSVGWWSLVPEILMQQWSMKEINPDAEWAILPAIKGPEGKAGFRAQPAIQTTISISKDTENPVAVMKLLDYIVSEEGWQLASKGIAGVHYDPATGEQTEEGKKGSAEKWLGVMSGILSNVTVQEADWEKNSPEKWEYIKAAKEMPLYESDMYSIVTDESTRLSSEIKKLEEEWFIKFVTGEKSIEEFDAYVKDWEEKGGLTVAKSYADEYNRRNGTNIEVAPLS